MVTNADPKSETTGSRSSAFGRGRILIAVLILLAGALLLVDFRLMHGQYSAEHQVFTSTFGQEGPQEIVQNQDVDLYFLGANYFTRGMLGALTRALEANPYIGEVRLREGDPQPTDGPVMVVRIDQADLLWAAVYGRARLKAHVSYASNGAVDWMDDEVVHSMPGPYTKWISGDFTATDNAFGLISLPGYASYLGQQMGTKISEAVEASLRD